MKIVLVGYMGSGKSSVGTKLAKKLNLLFYDLDQEIEIHESSSVSDIFKYKGEIFFRKIEHSLLKDLLYSERNFVLALGGGTPIFYDSMKLINKTSESFYLLMSASQLANRLNKEKFKRPIISNLSEDNLPIFIAKHLFERNPFYQLAKYTIIINQYSIDEICNQIISKIN